MTLRVARHGTTDVLTSIPGIGEIVATVTRGWFTGPGQFPTAKHAAAFVGLDPSRWESGLTASRSRRITKEGPAALRLAYHQTANVARRHDPQLAEHYRRLMVERNHNHTSACSAVARKLVTRAWAVIETGEPDEIRDLDGTPLEQPAATRRALELAVPQEIHRQRRAHQQRSRLDIDQTPHHNQRSNTTPTRHPAVNPTRPHTVNKTPLTTVRRSVQAMWITAAST